MVQIQKENFRVYQVTWQKAIHLIVWHEKETDRIFRVRHKWHSGSGGSESNASAKKVTELAGQQVQPKIHSRQQGKDKAEVPPHAHALAASLEQ